MEHHKSMVFETYDEPEYENEVKQEYKWDSSFVHKTSPLLVGLD